MSHTKGEWKIMPYTRRDGDNIRWVKAVRGKRHIPICQTFSPCAEANARLIAAAPDLLELCEEFMERADDGSADFDDPVPGSIFLRAKAAIAKATKEG